MVDCDYCDATLDGEAAYRDHLVSEHEDELGPIDRRRAGLSGGTGDSGSGGDESDDGSMLRLVGILFLLFGMSGVGAYAISGGFGGSSTPQGDGPRAIGSVHYHGGIDVTIAGQTLDFSRPRFQRPQQYPAFHFERGNGDRWHVHAQNVTLAYAMGTLGIDVTADSVAYDGTTYRATDENVTVSVQVNGQSVTPSTYVLQPGDDVQITVVES